MQRLVQFFCIVFAIFQFDGLTQFASAIDPVSFREDISLLLRKRCGNCHNAETRRGQLDLSSFNAIQAGSTGGPIAIAGKPDESMMYLTIARKTTPNMPPGNRPLPPNEVQRIRDWISLGMPETPEQAEKAIAAMPSKPSSAVSSEKTKDPLGSPISEHMINQLPIEPHTVDTTPKLANHSSPGSNADAKSSRSNVTTALAMSPDGKWFAISSRDGIEIQSSESNSKARTIPFEGEVFDLRFTQDGKRLVAAGGIHVDSAKVSVLDMESGKITFDRSENEDIYLSADLSPDARLLAIGGPSKVLEIVSVANSKVVHRMSKHTDWILSTSFSPDGLLLASGDRAGNLFVYESESGVELHTLRGHKTAVIAQGWLDAGDFLVTADAKGQVFVWNMHTGEIAAEWVAHEKGCTDLHVAENAIVTCGRDNQVQVWDRTGKSVASTIVTETFPLKVRFHPTSRTLAVGDWAGQIVHHEIKNLNLPTYVASPILLASAAALSRIELPTSPISVSNNKVIGSSLFPIEGSLDNRLSMTLQELAMTKQKLSAEEASLVEEKKRIESQLLRISDQSSRANALTKAIEVYLNETKLPSKPVSETDLRSQSTMGQ